MRPTHIFDAYNTGMLPLPNYLVKLKFNDSVRLFQPGRGRRTPSHEKQTLTVLKLLSADFSDFVKKRHNEHKQNTRQTKFPALQHKNTT
jgi:hypothetical protein